MLIVKMTCFTIKSPTTIAIGIILHILILFTFLSLFFKLYISNLETEKFKEEIDNLISSNVSSIVNGLDSNIKNELFSAEGISVLNNISQIYSKPDNVREINNYWVQWINVLLLFVIITSLLTSILIIYISFKGCIPLKTIILENMVIFTFIGIVEYLFFTKIAFKYIPVAPSTLVKSFYSRAINNLR